jgi:hypothetical protein
VRVRRRMRNLMFGSQLTLSLASAGVFVAALAVGSHLAMLVLSRSFKAPPVALFGPLAISLGLIAATPVLLLCAIAGVFAPPVMGLAGWIVVAVVRFRVPASLPSALFRRTTLLLLAVAVAAGCIAYFSSGDHIYGGRDQGFYTNLAIWMADHGKTVVDFPLQLSDPTLKQGLAKGFTASGLYLDSGRIVSQFSHAYPAWLAQAHAVAGHSGMAAFNGFLAASCALLFFALARCVMRPVPALLATAFLAFSPAQIWISRITLTELLAQQAFLAMSLMIVWAVRRRCPRLAVAGGLTAASVFLVRIDGMVLLPPLFVGTALALLLENRDLPVASSIFRKIVTCALGAFALCLAYYWIDTRPYLAGFANAIEAAVVLSVAAGLIGLQIRRETADRLGPLFRSLVPRVAFVAVLLALFAWAYFVRPRHDVSLAGFRDMPALAASKLFAANALWNLGQYLSPVVLFAGAAGFSLFVLARRMPLRLISFIPVAAVWLAYAVLMVQDPRISADHPWAVRRFVPVVLPGFILFAFLLVDRIESMVRKRVPVVAMRTAIAVAMSWFFVVSTPPDLLRREFDGSREFLAELARQVPSDIPVFAHGSLMWTLPLRMAFDRPVFFVDLNTREGRRLAADIADRFPDRRCAVIHNLSFPSLSAPELVEEFTWAIDRIEVTPYPLAKTWRQGVINIRLDLLDDATALLGIRSPMLGGQRVPEVAESGFYGQEYDAAKPFRWTMGTATLAIPIEAGTTPRSLRINYASIHPNGSNVVVTVNGHRLFDRRVTAPRGAIVVEGLEAAGIGDRLDLVIESETFRPVDLGMGTDSRDLGLRISYIEIVEDAG